MKKILSILLFAFLGLFVSSCNDDEVVNTVDYDTYSVAYDITPVFNRVNNKLYGYTNEFNNPLVESDVVLIYMQNGTTSGSPIWKLLPYTYYAAENAPVDYTFDFSKYDIGINVSSTLDLDIPANSIYYTDKRFRVVVVPAKTGKSKNADVDYSDYNSVIKYYNIDESKIKTRK